MRTIQTLGVQNIPVFFDKGYDAIAVYEEAHSLDLEPIIPLKWLAKGDGTQDKHFAPTCLLEASYRYDSYGKRYGALKYVRPEKRCREWSLSEKGLCQKVIKQKTVQQSTKVCAS